MATSTATPAAESPAEPGHAEIVGGGIGGLTAAAALARKGWSVRLHERDEAIRASGSGIYLWDNGLAVLRAFGVLEQTIEGAHYGTSIQTRDAQDRVLSMFPTNGPGQVQVLTVMREKLIEALLHAARSSGVELRTSSTVISADPEGGLTTASGEHFAADLVVVADGVGSRLRDELGLLRSARRLGQVCARVVVPRTPDLVPLQDKDHYIEWMSGQRFLLYTPSSATEAYIALVCPEGDPAAADPVPTSVWKEAFPCAENLVEALGPAPRWDDFRCVELHSWAAGRVAVLGDAAHAQPPYLGQGGGCAMMSAVGLAHSLAEDEGSFADRLAQWEQRERPLIEHTQHFSFTVGLFNDVPESTRSILLGELGRSETFGGERLRAAQAVPTGLPG